MSVHDGVNIRPKTVDLQMHQRLGGRVSYAFNFLSAQVRFDDVLCFQEAFAHPRRSEVKEFTQASADVSVSRGNKLVCVETSADLDDLFPDPGFRVHARFH